VFDTDIVLHINAVFATFQQLGVGPEAGFMIEDDTTTWDAFLGADPMLNHVKLYICLKVRVIFDPPQTAALLEAMNKQIEQLEWRISVRREGVSWINPNPPPTIIVEEEVVW
jgi:hypothetical protein